jgi:hypothetical protein
MSHGMRKWLDSLSDEQRVLHEWVVSVTIDPVVSTVILGMAMRYASDNPKWTWFEVVGAVRAFWGDQSCL